MAIIIKHSTLSPVKADTIDATINKITIGSIICSAIFLPRDFFFLDSILFGPFSSRRLAARSFDKPLALSESSFFTRSFF